MEKSTRPEDILRKLSCQFERGEQPSNAELRALIRLCSHFSPDVREAALILLLNPPVSDEVSYHRELIAFIVRGIPIIRHLPLPLVELLLDVLTLTGPIRDEPAKQHLFGKMLGAIAKPPLVALFQKPVPLKTVLPYLPGRAFTRPSSPRGFLWKSRWRLFRKRILTLPPTQSSWSTPTLRDLQGIWAKKTRQGRHLWEGLPWLTVGRALLSRQHKAHIPSPDSNEDKRCNGESLSVPLMKGPDRVRFAPRFSYWGGGGLTTHRFMENLMEWQGRELVAIRDLAYRVSEKTRRVVLSLHNATLAAAGGWAFETFDASFPSRRLWSQFVKAVEDREWAMENTWRESVAGLDSLWRLWHNRLVVPRVLHALRESRVRMAFDPSRTADWERDVRSVEGSIDADVLSAVSDGIRYSWQTPVAPHQTRSLGDILHWREHRRGLWTHGLKRLFACIHEGDKALSAGLLGHLVFPWIDKFFISSLREGDSVYLPSLLQWMEGLGARPIVLFWDDTSRAEAPSFKLALDRMRRCGLPYRGIGIFDDKTSKREDALNIICDECDSARLFALRPFMDTHNPVSLHHLLQTLDRRFFGAYDSSWKDNLCFLYTGTQVFPLLSVQCDAEPFPGWVLADHAKLPFGAYFRQRLRQRALGSMSNAHEPFCLDYAEWASLL